MSVDPRAFVMRDAYEFAAFEEPYATPLVATGAENKPVIPAGGTVMVFGAEGAGKTTLLVDWAVHFAAGAAWLGLLEPTRPLTVSLLENEGVRVEFRRKLRERLAAWDGPALDTRLLVLEQPWGDVTLNDDLHRDELAHLINAHHVDLLIAGPLADLGVAGPGTPADVSDFGEQLALLRAKCEQPLAIVVAHHENRAGQMSGAWGRLPDTAAHVQPQAHGSVRVFWHKVRNASSLHKTTTKLVWADAQRSRWTSANPRPRTASARESSPSCVRTAARRGGRSRCPATTGRSSGCATSCSRRPSSSTPAVHAGGWRCGTRTIPPPPPRPTLDGVEDVVAVRPEDDEHDRPRPSVLPVRKDGVEDGRGRSSLSSVVGEVCAQGGEEPRVPGSLYYTGHGGDPLHDELDYRAALARPPLVDDDEFLPVMFDRLVRGLITTDQWRQADHEHRRIVASRRYVTDGRST